MGIAYDPRTLSWVVTQEKTDYKTDYQTNYQTDRPTNYKTNYKTDYLTNYATNLPTNLKFDHPTNLPTNLETNLNTNKTYSAKIDLPNGRTVKIEFVPVVGDRHVYTIRDGESSDDYEVTGVKATLYRALQNAGVPKHRLNSYANDHIGGVRNIRDKNNENAEKNAANAATNAANKTTNDANAKLNNDNYNANIANANTNAANQKLNETNYLLNQKNIAKNQANNELNVGNDKLNKEAIDLNEKNTLLNQEHTYLNTSNTARNNYYNKTLQIVNSTNGGDYVSQRDKLNEQDLINAGVKPDEAKELVDYIKAQYKDFYKTEKLEVWDTKLGVQPPYADYLINQAGVKPDAVTGTFDPKYYKEQNPELAKAYAEAVANDDLDIIERYGENNFYWQHYTNIGKAQGLRGNPEEATAQANSYIEEGPTDAEIQQIRDLQLGVDQDTITQRLLNITEVNNEWTKARQGDPYWTALAKEKYLDVENADEFAVLFRLSDREQDKQIALNYNINAGSGITELEQAINDAIGAKAEVDIKKFAALNQSILKETIDQMKKVKAEQEMLSFYKGFQGFNEIFNINETLANSILGDTGVGGILSFTSAGKAEEDLLGALGNVTGMRNNVGYNWQQWFDQAIKEKYGIDYTLFEPLEEKKDIIDAFTSELTKGKVYDIAKGEFSEEFLTRAGFTNSQALVDFLQKQGTEGQTILDVIKGDPGDGAKTTLVPIRSRLEADIRTLDEQKDRALALSYTAGDKTQAMNIEAQFARDYIDEYLMPRFNTARSMDEFVEYLDVRQEEKNPFQTQDSYDALKLLGQQYTQKYLDDIKLEGPRAFDPNFYFNPITDSYNQATYEKQRNTVAEDWEKAKAGDPYWQAQAYRFGIDINNQAAFARMHFEVKGQGLGFDPAEDIVNAGKVKDFIYDTVLPVMEEEALKGDPVFGQFITPEEFADEMLRGLDPAETPDEWKEVLQRYGLQDFAGNIEELKEYIIETLRTGSAQEIREEIKYLNEKRQRPTQEILGVTYIERPEDYKDEMAKPTTQLYATFQQAGYQGTEDEFYENFFPDLDRSEMATLTKAGKDEALEAYGLDLSDPFASLGTIESFFPDYQAEAEKEAKEESPAEKFTSYFKIGIDDEEEEDYMSDAGQKFLGEFTSMFKGL